MRTLDITADMTRQYKAMQVLTVTINHVYVDTTDGHNVLQERFILEINTLNNSIVDLQDQLRELSL